jgi:hypothetical protein
MAERILMNEFKGLLKEKWVHVEVSAIHSLKLMTSDPHLSAFIMHIDEH